MGFSKIHQYWIVRHPPVNLDYLNEKDLLRRYGYGLAKFRKCLLSLWEKNFILNNGWSLPK